MGFEGLTEEQKARLRERKSKEDFVSLAQEGGVEPSDDMLEEVAGGEDYSTDRCMEFYSPCSYTCRIVCALGALQTHKSRCA